MKLDLRRNGPPLAIALLSVVAALVGARSAFPLPGYAARTGLDCRSCHFDPNGGGPRNGVGFLFALPGLDHARRFPPTDACSLSRPHDRRQFPPTDATSPS